MDYLDVKLVNCADCGVELLGESMAAAVTRLHPEAVPSICGRLEYAQRRANGRPYCPRCFPPKQFTEREVTLAALAAQSITAPETSRRKPNLIPESDNPWGDLATRHFEERFDSN